MHAFYRDNKEFKQTMRIGLLTPELPPGPAGGIGTFTDTLARALTARGIETTVILVGQESHEQPSERPYHVVEVVHRSPPKLGWFTLRREIQKTLRSLVKKGQIDVLEAPEWLGLTAGVRPGVPVAIRCHGSGTYFADVLKEHVRTSVRIAERVALSNAASIAAVSSFTATRTMSLFNLSTDIRTIHNAVDPARYSFSPPNSSKHLLYFGSIVRKKGVLDLAEAFSTTAAEYPEAHLTVLGRDVQDHRTGNASTSEMMRSYWTPQVISMVDQVGSVQPTQVPNYIAAARACVMPSYAEALPFAWLEAMAQGRAVIGYATPWAQEIVRTGVDGLLVEVGDTAALALAMNTILEDYALAQKLGTAARERIKECFDLKDLVDATIDWYTELLAKG